MKRPRLMEPKLANGLPHTSMGHRPMCGGESLGCLKDKVIELAYEVRLQRTAPVHREPHALRGAGMREAVGQ